MTQEIINNFLLKVGASRYQDPEFKKRNPGFNSISRFGIGVLSTFMIADSVEIISCHPDEAEARRLLLRSVHGKYLIRLLDKAGQEAREIGPHGTCVRLRLRPSVEIEDVIETAKQWIVIPDCTVTVECNDNDIVQVGFPTPADALRDFLSANGYEYREVIGDDDEDMHGVRRIRIVQRCLQDVTIAYAVKWNTWFKEWAFLTVDEVVRPDPQEYRSDRKRPLLGTCVEGIRIVNDTPGFDGYSLVSLANVKGELAPKTNVARSGLEVTPERDSMLSMIYEAYALHVSEELADLAGKRAFSPTWAAGEASYLLTPLFNTRGGQAIPLNTKILNRALDRIPCIMIEDDGRRRVVSAEELSVESELWTIDCGLLESAEALIREVSSAASLSGLVSALNVTTFAFPEAPVVCGSAFASRYEGSVFQNLEVDRIVVDSVQRRVDLRWVRRAVPSRWVNLPEDGEKYMRQVVREREQTYARRTIEFPSVPADGVVAVVPGSEIAVRAFGHLYLVPDSEVARFARKRIESVASSPSHEDMFVCIAMLGIIGQCITLGRAPQDADTIKKSLRFWEGAAEGLGVSAPIEELFDVGAFFEMIGRANWRSFDTWAWRRDGRSFGPEDASGFWYGSG
jgi:hypothetical protein